MSTCCLCSASAKKQACPCCEHLSQQVNLKTVLQHIKQAWTWTAPDSQLYHCGNQNCELVYFQNQQALFYQKDLRTQPMLCYCFGISHHALTQDPSIKDFVLTQTKQKRCSCDSHNPSGRCCLSQFPKS